MCFRIVDPAWANVIEEDTEQGIKEGDDNRKDPTKNVQPPEKFAFWDKSSHKDSMKVETLAKHPCVIAD